MHLDENDEHRLILGPSVVLIIFLMSMLIIIIISAVCSAVLARGEVFPLSKGACGDELIWYILRC